MLGGFRILGAIGFRVRVYIGFRAQGILCMALPGLS